MVHQLKEVNIILWNQKKYADKSEFEQRCLMHIMLAYLFSNKLAKASKGVMKTSIV